MRNAGNCFKEQTDGTLVGGNGARDCAAYQFVYFGVYEGDGEHLLWIMVALGAHILDHMAW